MKHPSQTGPSQRQLRVGEQLKQIIASLLQRGDFHHEALLNVMLSVAEVRTTPDLKSAIVYVSVLGQGDIGVILKGLNEEAHIFQKEINRQSTMKFTPRVSFKEDTVGENSSRINELLNEINKGE